jgi:hypothetical protein
MSIERLRIWLPPQCGVAVVAIPNPALIEELYERLNLPPKIVAAQHAVFVRMTHAFHSTKFRLASVASRTGCVCHSLPSAWQLYSSIKPGK